MSLDKMMCRCPVGVKREPGHWKGRGGQEGQAGMSLPAASDLGCEQTHWHLSGSGHTALSVPPAQFTRACCAHTHSCSLLPCSSKCRIPTPAGPVHRHQAPIYMLSWNLGFHGTHAHFSALLGVRIYIQPCVLGERLERQRGEVGSPKLQLFSPPTAHWQVRASRGTQLGAPWDSTICRPWGRFRLSVFLRQPEDGLG